MYLVHGQNVMYVNIQYKFKRQTRNLKEFNHEMMETMKMKQ